MCAHPVRQRPVTALPAKRVTVPTIPRAQEARVDLVADHNRRHPGEELTLYARVTLQADLTGCSLEVRLPQGLIFRSITNLHTTSLQAPQVRRLDGDLYLLWTFDGPQAAHTVYEYALHTLVDRTPQDVTLDATAVVMGRASGDRVIRDEESLFIEVAAKSDYMRYLPALYTQDELMGRYLMIFESLWAPINSQIGQLYNYFDPTVTPADMLPWLASWLGLVLDPTWPEEQRRRLLRSARRLFQKRGTRAGLQEYLEIYTGGQVQIIEHRAGNFRLKEQADLGSGVALGRDNRPYTFTVILRLPPGQLGTTPEQQDHWRRVVSAIIDQEKPAHTAYTLVLEPLNDD